MEAKPRGYDKKIAGKCGGEQAPEYCKDYNIEIILAVTELGDWTTFKVCIKNSKKNDGFVKVFKDDQLIMIYTGITFDWSVRYYASYIRVGIYRDSDPS